MLVLLWLFWNISRFAFIFLRLNLNFYLDTMPSQHWVHIYNDKLILMSHRIIFIFSWDNFFFLGSFSTYTAQKLANFRKLIVPSISWKCSFSLTKIITTRNRIEKFLLLQNELLMEFTLIDCTLLEEKQPICNN